MEEIESSLDNSVEDTPTSDASPESSDSTQEIPGLSEKFKFGEKVWNRDEFQKHYERLMGTRKNLESEYTKRFQDLKRQSEERKYDLNYRHDIQKVLNNPSLASEFKRIYPKDYHQEVDNILRMVQRNQAGAEARTDADQFKLPPELQDRLDKMERYYEERQKRDYDSDVQSSNAFIDSVMAKMSEKYPSVKDEFVQNIVFNNASALLDQLREDNPDASLTEKEFDALCKSIQDRIDGYADAKYKTKVEKQTKASNKAKDSGAGGGIPTQAPKQMGLREAIREANSRFGA